MNKLRPEPMLQQFGNPADAVAMRIVTDIDSGRLQPGAGLPAEDELARAIGVGRTIVCEAMAILQAAGFLQLQQNTGLCVVADTGRHALFKIDQSSFSGSLELTAEGVSKFLEFRIAVEPEAAALAAERASAATRRKLAQLLRSIEKAVDDPLSAVRLDFSLHLAIAEAASNPYFRNAVGTILAQAIPRHSKEIKWQNSEARTAYLVGAQNEHCWIVDAINRGDSENARAGMRDHLERSHDRYLRLVMTDQEGAELSDTDSVC
jgi:GntR family transcriptional regulator, transcriptional repressor for pyruvate dehydrogenase complex